MTYIKTQNYGIKEEKEGDFVKAIEYHKLEAAFDELIKAGYVRIIESQKTKVFFPCNIENKEIEIR